MKSSPYDLLDGRPCDGVPLPEIVDRLPLGKTSHRGAVRWGPPDAPQLPLSARRHLQAGHRAPYGVARRGRLEPRGVAGLLEHLAHEPVLAGEAQLDDQRAVLEVLHDG